MLDPRKKYMEARLDGLCPFCGSDVGEFPVCKNCNAEKIWSEKNTTHLFYDTIYFLILIPILLYFRKNIISFLDTYLVDFGEIPYYIILIFCLMGVSFKIYDLFNIRNFSGFGWKKRRR